MAPPVSASEAPDADLPATAPPRTGAPRIAPMVALVGVVVALIGVGLMSRPLSTPTQDCGTALTFLLDGEPNQWIDVDNPPDGVTPAQGRANNDHPCQERAANQARPAAALVAAGTSTAFLAAIVETTARNLDRRRQMRGA